MQGTSRMRRGSTAMALTSGLPALARRDRGTSRRHNPPQRTKSGRDSYLIIGGAPWLTGHPEMFPLAWLAPAGTCASATGTYMTPGSTR